MAGAADAVVLIILAWIFPPIAVAIVAGCGADLCINLFLTFLGYLPGCIHAFWIVLRRAEANERYGYNNWTYKGMGEYLPRGLESTQYPVTYSQGPGQAPPPPPPPPGPYPAGKAPLPNQPPVDQGQAPADPKSGGYMPPPAPAYQKYEALPQMSESANQTPAVSTAQTTAPGPA